MADAYLPTDRQYVRLDGYMFEHIPAIVTTNSIEGPRRYDLVGGFLVAIVLAIGEETLTLFVIDSEEELQFTICVGRDEEAGVVLGEFAPMTLTELHDPHVTTLLRMLIDLIDMGMATIENA